jgi:DNA-binding NarL/FixJ family response regulator
MAPMGVRTVIADDNFLLREGLERLLATVDDIEVVASCDDYDSLLAAVDEHRPDAVLADIRMPPTHTDEGVRAALQIRATHPETGVVMLSQHASPTYASALLGATTTGIGYLLKDRVTDVHQLVGALRTVATGGSVVDPIVVEELIAARRVVADSPLASLTEREREVLAAMAEGLSNAAIAARTFASERTVEKHINTIFSKLQIGTEPDVNRRVKAVLVYLTGP